MQAMARGTKSLDVERNERIRGILRDVLVRNHEGNQAALARAMGTVTPATVSDFLAGKRGAGESLIAGLARITGRTPADIRGERVEYDPGQDRGIPPTALGHHPDWAQASAEAVARYGRTIDPDILALAAGASLGAVYERLTPEIVKAVCDAITLAEAAKR